jgi:hypothetical protein
MAVVTAHTILSGYDAADRPRLLARHICAVAVTGGGR